MPRLSSRWVSALAGLALVTGALVVPSGAASAAYKDHVGLVPQDPARGYPLISDQPPIARTGPNCNNGCDVPREVMAANQVDRYIVAGGNFLTVELQNGTTISQPYFTAWNIDTKQIACTATRFDNDVLDVIPGNTPDTFFVAGRFSRITGPDGIARSRNRIAKLKLPDCSVDLSFVSPAPNSKVDELALSGNRLFLGGDFSTIGGRAISTVAELDATTGAVNPNFTMSFSGRLTSAIRGIGVNPAGTRLIFGGRFGTVSAGGRSATNPTAVIDITGASPVVTAHSSTGYTTTTGSSLPVGDLQDASVSKDGSVVGLAYGTGSSSDWVYLTPTTESSGTRYRWRHYMRDSSFGIAVSNNAVYVTGHFCRPDSGPGATDVMAPVAGITTDCTGAGVAGGVWRSKIAALSLTDGTPLTWNPGNHSFRGGQRITVTTRGLLVGFDGNRSNNIRTGALSFFDFGPDVEDVAPPSAVTFTAPAEGTTVGNPMTLTGSATDDLKVGSFRITVQAADGQYVQADGNLAPAVHTFTPAASATGSFSQQLVMPAGTYTASAVAVDVIGKVSATATTRAFVQSGLDGVAPASTISVPGSLDVAQPVTITGLASDNELVTALRARVTNSAGQFLRPDGTFSTKAANLPLTLDTALPAERVTWTLGLGALLPQGTYSLQLRVTDSAANATTPIKSFTVSATAPSVTIASPADVVPSGAAPTLAGVVTDNYLVAGATVALTDAAGLYLQDDGTFAAAANDLPATVEGLGTPSATFTYPAPVLPTGDYTVRAAAVDPGGSVANATKAFRVQSPVSSAISSYSGYSSSTTTGTFGYSFRVSAPTTLSAIGVHDTNRNGRIDNSSSTGAGIWQQGNTTPLATSSVPSNATATNGWAWAELGTPIVLQPGITYVVGVQSFWLREQYARDGTAVVNPAITITARASVTSFFSSLSYPGNFSSGTGYGMPNLRIQQ